LTPPLQWSTGAGTRLRKPAPILMAAVTLLPISSRLTVPLEDVYGQYRREYPPGFEALIVRRDETFEQQIHLKNQPPRMIRGLWGSTEIRA
jgi:hypothetical protein